MHNMKQHARGGAVVNLLFDPNSIASCTTVLFPLNEKVTPNSVWLSLSGKPKIGGGMASAGTAARASPVIILVNSIFFLLQFLFFFD